MASRALSVGEYHVLCMCVVMLSSGSLCLPASLLDSRHLSFLPCSFSPAGPDEDLKKKVDESVLLTACNSFSLFLRVLFPICSSDVDSDRVVG